MTPVEYVEIARARTPRGEVVLRERHDAGGPAVLELRVNGVYVMDTRETTTERVLARRALEVVDHPRAVLVGGLGLGFTAHELVADARVERVDVVELEQVVVDWMRDGTVGHGPSLLADRRINVVVADVRQAVEELAGPTYDLVLLDVDNGPGQLVHEANAAVYEPAFLASVRRVLRPTGAVVVWSAQRAPALADGLAAVFGTVEERALPVDLQGRAEAYWLYTAPAPPSGR